ncbi:hypothetical protein P0Y43_12400 [Pseudomonas entomophila]|uniref:DUF6543 domain-containing protein n=1 Tax=Pseudomonas entomophila TaxID=312306 RepID=UPI0023D85429|nr:DUF6543 domain-containing protein [Pseudomonas entomophila]MDF0731525.1 hypothetical protein [Pseudomonas entomophila]
MLARALAPYGTGTTLLRLSAGSITRGTRTMNTHPRVPRSSSLECAVTKRFDTRPGLLDVAAKVLEEQWNERKMGAYSTSDLYLVSRTRGAANPFVRPLHHVLVERYCHEGTTNLTPGEDHVSNRAAPAAHAVVEVDLHALEQLINDCGPLLFEAYAQALVAFWGEADAHGQTPWQWYSDYLHEQLRASIERQTNDGTLSQQDAAMASLVRIHSNPQALKQWENSARIALHILRLDRDQQWQLAPDLASAVLMEREQGPALLYTLAGRLIPFASRQDLLDAIAQHWPPQLASQPPLLSLARPTMDLFQEQTLSVLHQQLLAMEHTCLTYRRRYDSRRLANALDRIGDMAGACGTAEQNTQASIAHQLPDWLRNASTHALMHYSTLLTDIASCTYESAGHHWLAGIEDAEAFAYRLLSERIVLDHPRSTLDLRMVRVVNHQVIAAAIPTQGSLIQDGVILPVSFTLAQLAISNLGLLRPGTITLEPVHKQALPSWLDAAYVRQLVSEVDIGTRYPQMLRQQLLDDPQQRRQREELLGSQLKVQLPAMAMELCLLGAELEPDAVDMLGKLFAAEPQGQASRWVLRPLGFLSSMDASPDHPLNTWLIESPNAGASACLLYRPLHQQALLLFKDRLALLVAIGTPGALQDDLLQRLPAEARSTYAHGGFLEPHLFHPIDDPASVPFGKPAPVTLSREAAPEAAVSAIYQGCVDETLQQFEAHSATTAQTRWARWAELGWLLLDTVLPFTEGAIARIGWLAQIEAALTQAVDPPASDDPAARNAALAQLLLDLAMIVLHHAIVRQALEAPARPALPNVPPVAANPVKPRVVPAAQASTLDFRWSNATLRLSEAQAQAVGELRAGVLSEVLGPAIPSGPLQGLHLYEDACWAILENAVYKVKLDNAYGQPRVVGGLNDETLGPWLQLDDAGRWHVDLRLRLRGGMPLETRLKQMRVANEQAITELDAQLRQDTTYLKQQVDYLEKVAQVAAGDVPPAILRNYLDKAQAFSTFCEEHLARLKQRNAKAPLREYKLLRASGLSQRLRCEQSIRATLVRLYRPLRTQVVEITLRQREGYTLSTDDVRIVNERLDTLLPLLDQIIGNSARLSTELKQLRELASLSQPKIHSMLEHILSTWVKPTAPMMWRLIRLESCTNQLSLLAELDDVSTYWLDRFWSNIELGVAQHLHFNALENASDEIRQRLLQNIDQHVGAAQRQLDNLQSRLTLDPTTSPLSTLREDVEHFARRVKLDLAEYPDYTSLNSIPQLRRQMPGLIETPDEGLLLGTPRQGNDDIIDIPASGDAMAPTRTYKLEQGDWVRVQRHHPPKAAGKPQKLRKLLDNGEQRLRQARETLANLRTKAASSYLPVEIEEILLNQRRAVDEQRGAIEQRLTADNQTDERDANQDAALTIKALEDLSGTLAEQALALRTQAALAQKPRMGELRFLIDNHQVEVRKEGTRRLLARSKDRPDDYLDEYAISHDGVVLWYAHFHYRSADSERTAFTAGHLKTAAQRFVRGQWAFDDTTGKQVEVYRGLVTQAAASSYFFNL